MKPKIELWETVGTGLIIEYPTGVLVTNQTGGTSCLHPELEGIYVPMCNDYSMGLHQFISPEIKLAQYFEGPKYKGSGATNGIDKEDVEFLNTILDEMNLTSAIEIDHERLKDSHEAWIWLNVISDDNMLFTGFKEAKKAVLTWANSD